MTAKMRPQLRRAEDKPPGEPRMAEFKAACAYAKVGATKMYGLIKDGKVEAYKDGAKTLIDLNTVDRHHRSLPRLIMRGAADRSKPRTRAARKCAAVSLPNDGERQMPYISDSDAMKLGKEYLSAEEYAEFSRRLEQMRHFDECLSTSSPSPRCRFTDPIRNLEWCGIAFHIEATGFEDLLQEILIRSNFAGSEPE
jgi:hypothetical protein